jgi:hypothetical protein
VTDLGDKDQKEVIKQAIKEWMDDRYAEVGKWFIKSLLIAGVTSFLFWYISVRGYKFP